MKNKKHEKEKKHVENELTKLLEMTLMLENELYCISSKNMKLDS